MKYRISYVIVTEDSEDPAPMLDAADQAWDEVKAYLDANGVKAELDDDGPCVEELGE
jgi:hypothetical protein